MVGLKLAALATLACAAGLAAEPIRPHPANPHCFLFRGKPLAIVSSGEHYGAVLNLDFDFIKYLDTLSRDGMNYTRLFTGSYVEVPGDFGIERNTLAPPQSRFLAPWARDGKFDLDAWNPEYFERLTRFIGEASKRGVIVEVTLFCATYGNKQWSVSPFNPANNINQTAVTDWHALHTLANGNLAAYQERLTRKLVRELNGFDNVIFEIQNEPWADRAVTAGVINPYLPARWPNTADLADAQSLEWQRTVARWIREEESALPNRHSIAWNVCNFRYPLREPLAGADVVNFHYAYPEAALWNRALNVPIAYDETGFAGTADSTYRKQAWRFLLAGGGSFNALDYSFSVGKEDGSDSQPKSPGGGSAALRRQLRVLSGFLHALPLLRLAPDLGVVAHAPGVESQALSVPGEVYAIYLAGNGPTELTLNLRAGRYGIEWLDPATGATVEKRPRVQFAARAKIQSPPFSEDIVLRLSR